VGSWEGEEDAGEEGLDSGGRRGAVLGVSISCRSLVLDLSDALFPVQHLKISFPPSSLLPLPTRYKLTPLCSAFSALTSDGQFAALGLVLLATLSRVASIVGLPTPLPAESSAPAPGDAPQRIRVARVRQTGQAAERGVVTERVQGRGFAITGGEDVGEVVSESLAAQQDDGDGGEAGMVQQSPEAAATAATNDHVVAPPARKETKRKKGQGNAIDELFAGLS
jgi:hypothetical protein